MKADKTRTRQRFIEVHHKVTQGVQSSSGIKLKKNQTTTCIIKSSDEKHAYTCTPCANNAQRSIHTSF